MSTLGTWKRSVVMSMSVFLSNRIDATSYFLGKIFRFLVYIALILSIFQYTNNIAGYGKYEMLFFFLTFNAIDVLTQLFFRGLYDFHRVVRQGKFDFWLSKPYRLLFFTMTRWADVLDLIYFVPNILALIYVVTKLPLVFSWAHLVIYLLLTLVSIVIILSIHIVAAALVVWTQEVQTFLWLYRDIASIGRFPPEIMSSRLAFSLTFVLPSFLIAAFPVKGYLGSLSLTTGLMAVVYALITFQLSLLLWRFALKKYSSASS